MTTTRYTASRKKRTIGWIFIAVVPLLGLFLAARGTAWSGQQVTLDAVSLFVLLPMALGIAGRDIGATTTSARGIGVKAPFIARKIAWRDVTAIGIVKIQGRKISTYTIQIRRAHGRPIKLPGFSADTPDDPKLISDLEAIRADWEAATERIPAQV